MQRCGTPWLRTTCTGGMRRVGCRSDARRVVAHAPHRSIAQYTVQRRRGHAPATAATLVRRRRCCCCCTIPRNRRGAMRADMRLSERVHPPGPRRELHAGTNRHCTYRLGGQRGQIGAARWPPGAERNGVYRHSQRISHRAARCERGVCVIVSASCGSSGRISSRAPMIPVPRRHTGAANISGLTMRVAKGRVRGRSRIAVMAMPASANKPECSLVRSESAGAMVSEYGTDVFGAV